MNSVEIEKKIRELVGHYLIKDYHITVKRGDVILWLPDICKDSPFNKLMDEVYGALDDSIRITVIYPNNGKKVSEFIKENMEEIKRMNLISLCGDKSTNKCQRHIRALISPFCGTITNRCSNGASKLLCKPSMKLQYWSLLLSF